MTEPIPAVAPPPAGSFGKGVAAAIGAAVVGAVIWAVISVNLNYRLGIVAVGIGFLVGFAIERLGGGDRRLPVAGAVIALFGCVLGYLFTDAHALAAYKHIGIFSEFGHPHEVWTLYTHDFAAFDAVFYAIAAYEGFQFGRRGMLRAQAAAAANQPPSIEVPGAGGQGPALGYGMDPSAPLGSATAETGPGAGAPNEPPPAP